MAVSGENGTDVVVAIVILAAAGKRIRTRVISLGV